MGNRVVKKLASPAAGVAALLLAAGASAAPPAQLTVGTMTLTLCNSSDVGYCGSVTRPLDPVNGSAGTIKVGFEFYPRSNAGQASLGTIVPQEGGPGYSSTGTREAYLGLFEPLRDRRDVLIVDKRGTGRSAPVNCSALQADDTPAAIAACAAQLGNRAWYYGTALAAADLAAVLDALALDRVDLYGDSYGTYFAQAFAARFPNRLRSIILDSAYPVRPPDPWFPTDWKAAVDGFDLACERSPSCNALGGSPAARLAPLIATLRTAPISGKAPDMWGTRRSTTLDIPKLIEVMFNAGNYPVIYRDLDAAVRAWQDRGDRLPLLRLAAEVDTDWGTSSPSSFSAGLYAAVVCAEYPLLYSLSQSPAQRRTAYGAAIAQARTARANLFAPFSFDEGVGSGLYVTPLDQCLDWPGPPPGYAQGDALPAHPVFPPVPTLVLSGDLDAVTSVADATQAAAQFPDVLHLVIQNLTHITAFSHLGGNVGPAGVDETNCVSHVVVNFIRNLAPGDTGCISGVRPQRTVPRFATKSTQLVPVAATSGNAGSATELRYAAAALETVGDVLARYGTSYANVGAGLRAGKFTWRPTSTGQSFTLKSLKWVTDVVVSGTMTRNLATGAVSANVKLVKGGRNIGSLAIAWNDGLTDAVATLTGTLNGKAIRARRLAP
jgi:pimeloyl-ACP methyl ester carboxylesterase